MYVILSPSLKHVCNYDFKMYNDPTCKPWNSKSWAPEGYASRADVHKDNKNSKSKGPQIESTAEAGFAPSDEEKRDPTSTDHTERV